MEGGSLPEAAISAPNPSPSAKEASFQASLPSDLIVTGFQERIW